MFTVKKNNNNITKRFWNEPIQLLRKTPVLWVKSHRCHTVLSILNHKSKPKRKCRALVKPHTRVPFCSCFILLIMWKL